MAQNRGKGSQNGVKWWLQRVKLDQNKVAKLQNAPKTASRAQIVGHSHQIAPQGRSRSHSFTAFGRQAPNLVHKGAKGPICCQIWNGFGSIGSVFGSSVPPNASCVSQKGSKALKGSQNDSKWLKTAPKWPKVGSKWLKVAQNGPK